MRKVGSDNTLPINASNRRRRDIEQQFAFVKKQASSSPFPFESDIVDRLIESIETALERANQRRNEYLELSEQNARAELRHDFYQRYVTQLDFSEAYLSRLQQTLTYTEIYQRQYEVFADRLDYTIAVCDELEQVFNIDADIIPVIWNSYALLTILEADLYVLWIPRDEVQIRNSPVIAHEFGHAVLEQMDQTPPQPFRDRLAAFADGFPDEQYDAVIYSWNQWFEELFCDAIGFFTFGPAYLLSIIYRLQQEDPFHFPDQIGPDSEFHPPDALRFTYLDTLAAEYLPSTLYTQTKPARDEYDRHLQHLADEEPSFYDEWVNDDLLSLTTEAARMQGTDINRLVDQLTEGDPDVDGDRTVLKRRMACNETWFDYLQNGGY